MGGMIYMSQSKDSVVTIEPENDNKITHFLGNEIINAANDLEKMVKFMAYYGQNNNIKYTVEGSIIGCTYGLEKTRIGIVQDHAVSNAGGNAVLSCSDCVAGENVYSFGICCSPNINYQLAPKTTITRPLIYAQPVVTGPKCMLAVTTKWIQDKAHTHIWNGKLGTYEEVLLSNAYLPCSYGQGIITIKEVNNTATIKEYVNLTIMNNRGWKQIHCGYIEKNTGKDSPISDKTSVITRKHRSIDQNDIDKLNELFNKFDITTKNRICGFFAECSAETLNGFGMVEQAGDSKHPLTGSSTRANVEKWFNTYKKYGATYRGGGAIQLTWKSNYTDFSNWMISNLIKNDPDILNLGAEYVAFTYPWEAAVFFWDNNNLNSVADTMNPTYTVGDVKPITAIVNLNMTAAEYQKREDCYKDWMTNYTIPK